MDGWMDGAVACLAVACRLPLPFLVVCLSTLSAYQPSYLPLAYLPDPLSFAYLPVGLKAKEPSLPSLPSR